MSGLVYYAVLPPPVTGMTLVNQRIYGLLQDLGNRFYEITLKKKQGVSAPLWRFLRLIHVVRLVVLLPFLRFLSYRSLYMVPESGTGLLCTVFIVFWAKLWGYQVVLHHHVYKYIREKSWAFSFVSLVLDSGDINIFLGAKMRRDFQEKYGNRQRNQIAENYYVIEKKSGSILRDNNTFVVGHLSNICDEKGARDMMKIAEKIHSYGCKVVLAGPIADQCLKDDIQGLVAKGVLSWAGPLYGTDKEAFYRDINCFLFPSKYKNEASPLVLMEALSYGKPFVAYAIGGICDLADDSGGLIAEDCDDMASIAIRLSQTMCGQEVIQQRFVSKRNQSENDIKSILRNL